MVVDIRALNAITQPDAYPLPLQSDIIQAVQGCQYISVVDCSGFFYQWRVHPEDRHKLIVVSHRGQESFNVAVMGYRNSSAYVQRQIDRVLRLCRRFARAYVDDIVIFSRSLTEHLSHLRKVFGILSKSNISIKPGKAFIGYPSVNLLGQKVNSLGLATDEEKLRAIASLSFPTNLAQLETYLGLTGWFREYIERYAEKSKPLQERKTALLLNAPKSGSARKFFCTRTRLSHPTEREKSAFTTIQKYLFKSIYLVHFDPTRQLYVDIDASKEAGVGSIVYHLKTETVYSFFATDISYPHRRDIQPIMLLSRLLKPAETRYWSTEMEVVGLVWTLRKIRHLVDSSQFPTIVFIDHGATLGIAKQTSMFTSSIDKLNLRLVRASDYIQRFSFIILHRPDRLHVVPDALSRLPTSSSPQNGLTSVSSSSHFDLTSPPADYGDGELDVLYVCTMINLDEDFRQKLLDGYVTDPDYKKVIEVLNRGAEDGTKLPFFRGEDGLIYRVEEADNTHPLSPRRLCIPENVVPDIFSMSHNKSHQGFDKTYERVSCSYFIRSLTRKLKRYLKHCPQCRVYQTRRHAPYESLQSILSPPIPFHTITIDFILALPAS